MDKIVKSVSAVPVKNLEHGFGVHKFISWDNLRPKLSNIFNIPEEKIIGLAASENGLEIILTEY